MMMTCNDFGPSFSPSFISIFGNRHDYFSIHVILHIDLISISLHSCISLLQL